MNPYRAQPRVPERVTGRHEKPAARDRAALGLLLLGVVAGLGAVLWQTLGGAGPAGRARPRAAGGLLALAVLLFLVWRTAPPLPVAQVSSEAPPVAAEETLEGVVLASQLLGAPGAGGTAPGAGGPVAGVRDQGTGGGLAPPVRLTVRIANGSQRGRVVDVEVGGGSMPNLATASRSYTPGDRVVISYLPDLDSPPGQGGLPALEASRGPFQVIDHVRWPWLWWGAALFAVVVAVVARGQGARALVGLAVAVYVLWWFVIPRLLAAQPPVPVALVGCALIAVPALSLTNGFGRESLVPLAGIGGSLVVVGLLTTVAVQVTRLSGLATSEELNLVYVGTQGTVNPQGLLLAGMLIGAVGGLVDVTVGQAAAVFEFHEAAPSASQGVLFRRGMNVGRSHVAAAVHTLVLAYAGAALPLLLLFAMYSAYLGDIWNRELIVSEVLRSVAGSVGLAASMPLTTWLACLACRPAPAMGTVASAAPVPAHGGLETHKHRRG